MRRESSVQDDLTTVKTAQEQKWREEKEREFKITVQVLLDNPQFNETLRSLFELNLDRFGAILPHTETIEEFQETFKSGKHDDIASLETFRARLRNLDRDYQALLDQIMTGLSPQDSILHLPNLSVAFKNALNVRRAQFNALLLSIDQQITKYFDNISENSITRFECYENIQHQLAEAIHLHNCIKTLIRDYIEQLKQLPSPFDPTSLVIAPVDNTGLAILRAIQDEARKEEEQKAREAKVAHEKQLREDQVIAFRIAILELANSESLKKAVEAFSQKCRVHTETQLPPIKTQHQFNEAITTNNLDEKALFKKILSNLQSTESFQIFINTILGELDKHPSIKDGNIHCALNDVLNIYQNGFVTLQEKLCEKIPDYIEAISIPNFLEYRFQKYTRISSMLAQLLHLSNSIQLFTTGFTHQLKQIHSPFESVSFDIPSDSPNEHPDKIDYIFLPVYNGKIDTSVNTHSSFFRALRPGLNSASVTSENASALIPAPQLKDASSETAICLPSDIMRLIFNYLPLYPFIPLSRASKAMRRLVINYLLSQPVYKGWIVLDLLSYTETCRLFNITTDNNLLIDVIAAYRATSREINEFKFWREVVHNPTHNCFEQYVRSFYGITGLSIRRIPEFYRLAKPFKTYS
jgi:hypothetical protein